MLQRTGARRGLLTAIGAAVIMLVPVLAAGSAQAAPPAASTGTAAVRGVHVFEKAGFQGLHAWFDGNVGQCRYVGAGWNDRIRSARTESGRLVELWDHSDCTGGSIVVDRTGYGSIGAWVSAYRIR